MARINLLPWRVERRKHRQKEFMTTLGGAVVAGIALVFLTSMYYDGQISGQESRNAYLASQITAVDGRIKEIADLEARKASLLQRKNVIEDLQADRTQNVRLFEELVRTIPDGVRLVTIKQNGDELTLNGRTQSNARVSSYMRNLEASGLITRPQLGIIKASEGVGADRALPFEFEMKVALLKPGAEGEGDAATPAADGTLPPADSATPAAAPAAATPAAPVATPAPAPASAPSA